MLTDFFPVFDHYSEAVIAVGSGKILYCNGAAEKLLPKDVCRLKTADFLPEEFTSEGGARIAGRAEIFGKGCDVVSVPAEGCRIITVTPDEDQAGREELLGRAGGAINSSMAVFQAVYDMIQPYLDNLDDKKIADYVAMMAHSYYSVLRIAGNLSVLDGSRRADKQTGFDISELFRDITQTVSVLAPEKGPKIVFESGGGDMWFYGGRDAIERMLLNLLSNSLKFTGEGGTVRVSVARSGDKTVLTVSDNGEGIPPSELMHVFSACSVPPDSRDSRKGLGLGLYIVQKTASDYGGTAVLESQEGKGTKVTVVLPLKSGECEFRTSVTGYESYDMAKVLTELSDVLDYRSYGQKFTD